MTDLRVFLTFVVVIASPAFAAGDAVRSPEQAASLLEKRIAKDRPYGPSVRMECLSFEGQEESDPAAKDFAVEIREIHQGACAGEADPTTAPLLGMFLVTRDGTISWFDSVDAEYRSYEDFLRRQRQP